MTYTSGVNAMIDDILAEFTRPTREWLRTDHRPPTTDDGMYLVLDTRAMAECIAALRVTWRHPDETCEWSRLTESDGYWGMPEWQSACGLEFTITEGTPSENEMRFCMKCGRTLVET